jgi:DNA-binding transcriptional regulator GbsR (MarR family)
MKAVNAFHKILGSVSAVVVTKPVKSKKHFLNDCAGILLTTLKRRPQTIDDLANGLQLDYPTLNRSLALLIRARQVKKTKKKNKTYFVSL